jgi:DNA repair exonuclease SbcCD ATPase subunit
MNESTLRVIELLVVGLPPVGMLIIAWIMLRPRRRVAEAGAAADETGAALNELRIMEVAQAELRAQLAETRAELAEIKRQRHEEAVTYQCELASRAQDYEALQRRLAGLEDELTAETAARQELEERYHDLKGMADQLAKENRALRAELAARGVEGKQKAA